MISAASVIDAISHLYSMRVARISPSEMPSSSASWVICGAIALAKAMNLGREGLEFAVRDITAGVPEKRHDVAILMEVLEHIPVDEAVAFLRGVAQQIVHGGFLLLTVPHENKPVEYKHFRHFSVSALMAALNADFDVLEVVPFERRCLSMRLLGFMLGNRYFLLNHRGLLKAAYSYYKRHLFPCADEGECQRLFVVARVR